LFYPRSGGSLILNAAAKQFHFAVQVLQGGIIPHGRVSQVLAMRRSQACGMNQIDFG
jgi:hypothetical protein